MLLILSLIFGMSAEARSLEFPRQGDPNKELYHASAAVSKPICTREQKTSECQSSIQNLDCNWKNGTKFAGTICTYESKRNKTIARISGTKAVRLAKAVMALGKTETSGAAGRMGFAVSQDSSCSEEIVGRRAPFYNCEVSEHVATGCLSDAEAKELAELKAEYTKAKNKNFMCVNSHGAAACLSPMKMAKMAKLEERSKKGCRPIGERPSPYGRDVEPTMDHNND